MIKIGTDILDLKEFPHYFNGDENRFFRDNFTKREIKYTLTTALPEIEFARLFSIKESLVKANNKFLNTNFNCIEILSKEGNVSFSGCKISSSVDGDFCISVVLCV